MKTKKVFVLLFGFIITIMIFIVIMIVLLIQNQSDLIEKENIRGQSIKIANELRQSSDDLTNYCRLYVMTGDTVWETKYWNVLQIRNGKLPRAGGQLISLRDSMLKLGFTSHEFDLLSSSENNSNELVLTERVAFNSLKGILADSLGVFSIHNEPNIVYAQQIMFDEKYLQAKTKIVQPINEFIIHIDERTNNVVKQYRRKSYKLLGFSSIVLIAGIIISLNSYFLIRKRLIMQVRAEEALRASESKYKALFTEAQRFRNTLDKVPSYVFMKDIHSRYIYANQMTLDLFKCSAKELIGNDDSKFFPPDTVKHLLEIDSRVFNGETTSEEVDTFDKKGKGNYFLEVKSPIVEEPNGNKIVGLVGIATDITERKQAEEALIVSEEKFRSLYNNSPDMYVSVSPDDATILLCNATFIKSTGYSKDEIIGAPIFKMYHDDCMEDVKNTFQQFTQTGEVKNRELILKRKDGSKIDVSLNVYGLRDKTGKILHSMSSWRDISERKLAEEALRESEAKFRALVVNNEEIIFMIDKNGIFQLSEGKGLSKLGLNPGQVVGESAFEIYKDYPDVFVNMKKALRGESLIVEQQVGDLYFSSCYSPHQNSSGEIIGVLGLSVNITERKLAEEALRESEDKFRTLVINNEEIIFMMDKNGIFQLSEGKGLSKLGLNPGQIVGESAFEIYNDYPDMLVNMKKALKGESLTVEHQVGDLYFNSCYSPHQNPSGEIIGLLGLSVNITDRKQAEKELRESRTMLQAAMDQSPAGIAIADAPDGTLRFVNDAGLLIRGGDSRSIVDEIGVNQYVASWQLLDLDGRPLRTDEVPLARAIMFGETNSREFIVRRDKNDDRIVLGNAAPIKDDVGKVIAAIVVFTDITERKQADESLRESEAKLNALFTSLTEMVVMHELVLNNAGDAIDYRIIDCNKVFTEFTGIRKEDALGKLASEVYQVDPPPYLKKFAKVALGGEPQEFTTYYPPLDKHLMVSVVSPQAGKFATITTDISAMMQIQEMIVAKNKEMENYLYVASHDLRSPLVNIQGFSQRLKKQADSIKTLFANKTLEPEILHQLGIITDEDIPKTLSFVHSNIEKMDTLINGLLQLSRTGRVDMNIQKIDMNELFAKILRSLDFQINEAQCEIHINPLPACYGDAALLDQLFANIISNALKYSDSERALEITVDAKEIYNKVIYTIRDTGKGIAQKHLEKIWDVFYRIDPRSGKTGEGIGLSLVKRIAEKNKGKVWAESEENKGSVFYIELHNGTFTEI